MLLEMSILRMLQSLKTQSVADCFEAAVKAEIALTGIDSCFECLCG